MKTLTLTALATISRASTLAIMARRFSMENNAVEGIGSQLYVHFFPGRQGKTSRFHDGLFVSELTTSTTTTTTTTTYRLHCSRWTTALLADPQRNRDLFDLPPWISTKKSHQPVSPVTLAAWLKKAMIRGGIDTDVFKPHRLLRLAYRYCLSE